MAEPLGKEFVEFEANGLDEIIAATEDAKRAVQDLYVRQMAANAAMNDPAIRKLAQETARLTKANRDLLNTEEKLTEAEKQRLENATRLSAIRTGAYARETLAMGDLRREAEKLSAIERKQRLDSGLFQIDAAHDSRMRRASGMLAARERETMLTSGQFLRDARRDNSGRLVNDQLAVRERRALLESGEYLRDRQNKGNALAANMHLALLERNTALESGQYGREAGHALRLTQRADQLARAERGSDLTSGRFSASVIHRDQMARQDKQLERAERKAELQALNGKLFGGAMYGLERARPGMLAMGGIGAAGLAMGRSGLSGTVEGNALSMELHLLNREIAGALLPAVKELTRAVRWVRNKAEGLSPGKQDALGYGILAATGIGAIGLAANTIGNAVSGLSRLLGVAGMSAGGSVAASVASQAAGQAAGTAAGNIVGNAAAGAGGAAASRAGGLGRAAGAAGRLAPWVLAGASVFEGVTGNYYAGQRGRGGSKIGSGLAALGGGFMDTLSTPLKWMGLINKTYGEAYGEKFKNEIEGFRAKNGGKNSALISEGLGFEDFDSSYRRAATAVSLQAAMEQEPGGKLNTPERESADTLKLIWDLLQKFAMPSVLR